MSLKTDIRENGDSIVCYLDGRIVYETESILKSAIDEILQNRQKKKIVINLRDLSYINSSGIGLMVRILKEIRATGGELRLCCMQQSIVEVFKITNLDQVFKIFKEEEQALS